MDSKTLNLVRYRNKKIARFVACRVDIPVERVVQDMTHIDKVEVSNETRKTYKKKRTDHVQEEIQRRGFIHRQRRLHKLQEFRT